MFDVHETTAAAYSVKIDGDRFIYTDVNSALLELSGLTPRFIPGLDPKACFTEQVAAEILQRYRACRDSRQAVSYVSEVNLLKGVRRWRTTLLPTIDASGRVVSIIGVCVDAPEDVRSDQRIETREERLAIAMGAMDGGFWVYEMETGLFETSASLAQYIAGPGHLTLNLAEYTGYIYAEDLRSQEMVPPGSDRSIAEYRVITFDGRTRWLQSRRRVIRDKAGAVVRVIGLVMDITDQKKTLTTLETEASTDPLTSLKNRRAFDRAASQAFVSARKARSDVGVLLIDLDGFKPINDRYGHRAGDEILRKVARRLMRCIGQSDFLARLGGDEFAVLLGEGSHPYGDSLAHRIASGFEKPLKLEDQTIFVGVSTGLGLSTTPDASVEALLERADRNLYAAKKRNRLLTA